MSSEASAIARQIKSQIVIENQPAQEIASHDDPGVLKNLVMIGLMGVACAATKFSLMIVRLVKSLEK